MSKHDEIVEALARVLATRTRAGYTRDNVWAEAWRRYHSKRRKATYWDDVAIKHAIEDSEAILRALAASPAAEDTLSEAYFAAAMNPGGRARNLLSKSDRDECIRAALRALAGEDGPNADPPPSR